MPDESPSGFRDRIEAGFEAWGRLVVARPRPVLLASLVFFVVCASGLPKLTIDVTFEAFLARNDEVRVAYESYRDRFGRDERLIVAADPGASADEAGVFRKDFLERLRALHDALEDRVPYVVEVTSLVNARDTRGEGDTLLVEEFMDPWPEDAAALTERRARALANPLFRNATISEDGHVAAILIEPELYSQAGRNEDDLAGFEDDTPPNADEEPPLLSGSETTEMIAALRDVLNDFDAPDFRLHAAGPPVMLDSVAGSMAREMPRFVVLAIVSIATLLFLLFRRVSGVALPLLIVVASVASTFGLMGHAGASLHVPTQILPTFLLAVGIGDSVHLLAIFFERLRAGEAREDALPHALGHSGLALALTSLTTAAGLGSFAAANIEPVMMVGVFAPIGVMIALGYSLALLPALLTLAPLGAARGLAGSPEPNVVDRLLRGLSRYATRRPGQVLIVSALLSIAAVLGASRMGLSHNPLAWMNPDSRIVKDTEFIDGTLGGSVSFEVVLETEPGGVRTPETLRALATLGERLEVEPRDGFRAAQTISLADVVKEIHKALNADEATAYEIPGDPLLVAQELLLFENTGTDDLEDLTDSQYESARLTVRMPWYDAVRYTTFLDLAQADTRAALGEVGTPSTTGILALLVRSITAVVESMARSYALAFAIITPLMVLLLGNLRMGLLAMIPNTMPILLTLGVMGTFGLPLDAFSLMIGGIALGLAVDDTIHFMHNYRRYRSQGMSLEDAVDTTLQTAGRAMLITTIVLSVGFGGFVMSSMVNLANLGLLVAFAISAAFFADVLLAPALLAFVDRDRADEGADA